MLLICLSVVVAIVMTSLMRFMTASSLEGQGLLHFLLLGSIIPTRYIAKFLFRSSELLYNTKSSLKETNKYDINSYRVD